jgi:hypothetical protein
MGKKFAFFPSEAILAPCPTKIILSTPGISSRRLHALLFTLPGNSFSGFLSHYGSHLKAYHKMLGIAVQP